MTMKNLVSEVKAILGDGYKVETKQIQKSNGIVKTGIIITKGDEKISPTIYPEKDMTAQRVVDLYRNAYSSAGLNTFNVNDIDRDFVLDNVVPVLCNREANAELLETILHVPCADLEVVFRVFLPTFTSEMASFLIKKGQFELTEAEVYKAAIANVQGRAQVFNVMTLLTGMGVPIDLDSDIDVPMLVITYNEKMYGAGSVLDKKMIAKLEKKLGDFYILPSSIHEVLAVPADNMTTNELVNMVREINRDVLSKDEFLSDNVYKFVNGKLEVA